MLQQPEGLMHLASHLSECGPRLINLRDGPSGIFRPHGLGLVRAVGVERHLPGVAALVIDECLAGGATLVALATADFSDLDSAAEAKRLMREVLDHYLDMRLIFSRRIVRDLQAIDGEGHDS